jgi:hypothetical protein
MNDLVKHLEKCILLSKLGVSNLNKDIFYLDGMSSPKVRMLLNNLCDRPNTRYLEIGLWKGSTLVSALYNNAKHIDLAIAIDNFSQFIDYSITNSLTFLPQTFDTNRPPQKGNIKEILYENITKFQFQHCSSFDNNTLFELNPLTIIEGDCFDPKIIEQISQLCNNNKINIYFYDGDHDEQSQYNAFKLYNHIFDDIFIVIIDDWNQTDTKNGTQRAFEELKYEALKGFILPANKNGDIENWWNGLYVGVIKKSLERKLII